MRYCTQLFLALALMLTSCTEVSKRPLNLQGPTIEEAEQLNVATNKFVDGFYLRSDITTSLYFEDGYSEGRHYVSYRPIIVVSDFKNMNATTGYAGTPVIDIELHERAHETWLKATEQVAKEKGQIYVVLDGKIVAAPYVTGGIHEGKMQISGDFTMNEIQEVIQGIENRNSIPKK